MFTVLARASASKSCAVGCMYETHRRSLKTGIVGLPNVGKSTLFNAMMGSAAAAASNFPFCTIEPNKGTVPLADKRLDTLAQLHQYDVHMCGHPSPAQASDTIVLFRRSERKVPTALEFVDIAGIIKGASQGLGLGNKFLSHIRECDALVQVVRCFEDVDITHVEGNTNPLRDIEVINGELALADISLLENVISKSKKRMSPAEIDVLKNAMELLLEGQWLREIEWSESSAEVLDAYQLLTTKQMIYAANVSEDDLSEPGSNALLKDVGDFAERRGDSVVLVSAETESELAQMSNEERDELLEDLGIDSDKAGMRALVKAAYDKLDLITFYTAGEAESRAWTIQKGATAPQAAGKIHTDFEKGFIKAETVSYENIVLHGGLSSCKEQGLVRAEGKSYVVEDGDVMVFRFR